MVKVKLVFQISLLFFLMACQSAKKTIPVLHPGELPESSEKIMTTNSSLPPDAILEEMGPPMPYGPILIKKIPEEKSIVIVLGPGLARGFAHAGIIQALHSSKIPIAAILGTEMGSLIAAMYSIATNMNQFEWSLQFLKEDSFIKSGYFVSKLSFEAHEGIKLNQQLQKIFLSKTFQDAKIPLKVALQSEATGIPLVINDGLLSSIIRGALNSEKILLPSVIQLNDEKMRVVAATKTAPFLIKEAKELNLGPVVVVNVLGKNESSFASDELSKADMILEPELKEIDYFDYKKKNEIIYRGKKEVQVKIEEIKKLIGL